MTDMETADKKANGPQADGSQPQRSAPLSWFVGKAKAARPAKTTLSSDVLSGGLFDGLWGASESRPPARWAWVLWTPFALSLGILVYFLSPDEPAAALVRNLGIGAVTMGVMALAGLASSRSPPSWRPWLLGVLALALAGFGVAVASWRTDHAERPTLTDRMGPVMVEAEVTARHVTRAGPRLVLEVSSLQAAIPPPPLLAPAPAEATPIYTVTGPVLDLRTQPLTIRLNAPFQGPEDAVPGTRLRCPAVLFPPSQPNLPIGYDFARSSFFQGVGAVGRALGPCEILPKTSASTDGSIASRLAMARQTLGDRIAASFDPVAGALAAALAIGDERFLTPELADQLRHSGLGHLLAVSGLNMSLVAGVIFAAVRGLLAAFPMLAARFDVRKMAALAAILAVLAYGALCGPSASVIRATIMAVVGLYALLVDRLAHPVRALAVAATFCLVITPEALLAPGFQMSFAATAALIAAFGLLPRLLPSAPHGFVGRVLRVPAMWVLGTLLSTFAASAATMPFSAFHFHSVSMAGVWANMLTAPIIALLVPLTLLSLCLTPFGLADLPQQGLSVLLHGLADIAATAAADPLAQVPVAAFPGQWLALYAAGIAALIALPRLYQRLGVLVCVVALIGALTAPKPSLLIDADGKVMAARTAPDGLVVSLAPDPNDFALGRLEQALGLTDAAASSALLRVAAMSEGGPMVRLIGGTPLFKPILVSETKAACATPSIVWLSRTATVSERAACRRSLILDAPLRRRAQGVVLYETTSWQGLGVEGVAPPLLVVQTGEGSHRHRPWTHPRQTVAFDATPSN